MTIKVDAKKVTSMLLKFPKESDKAMRLTMNEHARKARTASSVAMRKTWVGLKARDLKQYTWTTNAKNSDLRTQFVVTSRSINLLDFVKKENKKGLSYRLKTKQRQMKGSFKAKGYFFTRSDSEKTKNDKGQNVDALNIHFSITPTSMFLGAKGDDVYVDTYFNGFEKRYFNQLNRLIK